MLGFSKVPVFLCHPVLSVVIVWNPKTSKLCSTFLQCFKIRISVLSVFVRCVPPVFMPQLGSGLPKLSQIGLLINVIAMVIRYWSRTPAYGSVQVQNSLLLRGTFAVQLPSFCYRPNNLTITMKNIY